MPDQQDNNHMELSLTTIHEPQLPPMAWLVTIAGSHATVHHGSRVETWETGFFEGAYAGRWLDDDPSTCSDVFGSGMVIRDGAFHFVTPSHTLEAIYSCQRNGVTAVSNSLAFLVERLAITVPVNYDYGRVFGTAVLGVQDYSRCVIRAADAEVERHLHDNLALDCRGQLKVVKKPNGPTFEDFASYIHRVVTTLRAVVENAACPDRASGFDVRPISTISSGYDSPAVTVLGQQVGCQEALTLTQARGGQLDSGEVIAHSLSLGIVRFDRPSETDAIIDDLAEFLAPGMDGQDYCYIGFAPILPGRVLLTGFMAIMWDYHLAPTRLLRRGDNSGSSLQEMRLRLGFVHIPVATIAITHHPEAYRLSLSQEMASFRLDSNYDKPIPRRIVESAGVSREHFGKSKKATSVLLFTDRSSIRPMFLSKDQIADKDKALIEDYANELGANPKSWAYRRRALLWMARDLVHQSMYRLIVLKGKLKERQKFAASHSPVAAHEPTSPDSEAVIETTASIARRVRHLMRLKYSDWSAVRHNSFPANSVMFMVGLDMTRKRYARPLGQSEIERPRVKETD